MTRGNETRYPVLPGITLFHLRSSRPARIATCSKQNKS